jgi:hypothetical protein
MRVRDRTVLTHNIQFIVDDAGMLVRGSGRARREMCGKNVSG